MALDRPHEVTIERVTTGEYKVSYYVWDSNLNQWMYTAFIGSCAQTMIFLPKLLFATEAAEDAKDKIDESKAIGEMVLSDMYDNLSKFIPKKAGS